MNLASSEILNVRTRNESQSHGKCSASKIIISVQNYIFYLSALDTSKLHKVLVSAKRWKILQLVSEAFIATNPSKHLTNNQHRSTNKITNESNTRHAPFLLFRLAIEFSKVHHGRHIPSPWFSNRDENPKLVLLGTPPFHLDRSALELFLRVLLAPFRLFHHAFPPPH